MASINFSNEDGNGWDEVLQKMYLYFTFECCSSVNLFSTCPPIGLKPCSG